MKIKTIASSPSRTCHSQADGFFAAFFCERQNNLYYRSQTHLYPTKAVIVKQDTPANAVFLIEQGLVKLVRETSRGNHVIVGLRHCDWLIGSPPVLLDRPYNYTVIALAPSSLLHIPKQEFLDHIKRNEQFSWHVHQLLSQEICDQMKKIEAMRCLSTEIRLMRLLADTVSEMGTLRFGTPDSFELPLTNQELAQLLVITPEHLCRVMKRIEQKGLIKRNNGTLIVTNPAGIMQTSMI